MSPGPGSSPDPIPDPSARAGTTDHRPVVLLADDDPALVRTLALTLRARGWEVVTAADGEGALQAVRERRIDVVVLDLGLPDRDGQQVVAALRTWSEVPIVVLSARHDADEKVEALDAGADDYVTKPFELEVLLARVRAALRRAAPGSGEPEPVVVAGDLRVDLSRRRVSRAGVDVRLSPTEWHLLEVLVRHRGRLVPRLQLLTEVWGEGYRTETNYLRVYSAQLRRKLEDDPSHPRHLITEPGMGYRFEV